MLTWRKHHGSPRIVGVADGNTTEHDNTTDYFTGTYHKVWLLSTRMDIAQISINPARLKSISLSKSRIHQRKNSHHHHYHVLQQSHFLATRLRWQQPLQMPIGHPDPPHLTAKVWRLNQRLWPKIAISTRDVQITFRTIFGASERSKMVSCAWYFHCNNIKTHIASTVNAGQNHNSTTEDM